MLARSLPAHLGHGAIGRERNHFGVALKAIELQQLVVVERMPGRLEIQPLQVRIEAVLHG